MLRPRTCKQARPVALPTSTGKHGWAWEGRGPGRQRLLLLKGCTCTTMSSSSLTGTRLAPAVVTAPPRLSDHTITILAHIHPQLRTRSRCDRTAHIRPFQLASYHSLGRNSLDGSANCRYRGDDRACGHLTTSHFVGHAADRHLLHRRHRLDPSDVLEQMECRVRSGDFVVDIGWLQAMESNRM